jgi:gamma-glutamyl-gamma-aminobutyrate hydrolase PuuD
MERQEQLTQPPLIGILTVQDERFHNNQKFWAQAYFSYVTRSYVDLVEESGSIPIFIPFDLPIDKLDYILDHVQAIIFPGADAEKVHNGKPTLIQQRTGYVIEKIKKFNDSGRYFPAFGECNGLQSPIIYLAGNDESYDNCVYRDYFTKHAVFKTQHFNKSEFWKHFDQKFLSDVFDSGEIYFSHNCGVSTKMIESNPVLNRELVVTGSSQSKYG